MSTTMVHQKCPGGRREIWNDTRTAKIVSCKCGRHPPQAQRVEVQREEEAAHQMSTKISAVHVDDTFRPTERPCATTDQEIAAELARKGHENMVAIVGQGGRVATVKVPVPYFSREWYDERMRKQRAKGR